MCEFCATTVILESVSAYSFLCDAKIKPVDGVAKRRNPSELKKLLAYKKRALIVG